MVKSHSLLKNFTHNRGWAFYLQFFEKILGGYRLLQHVGKFLKICKQSELQEDEQMSLFFLNGLVT